MKAIFNAVIISLTFCLCGCGYTTRGFTYQQNRICVVPVVNKMDIASEQRKYSQYNNFPPLLDKRITNAIIGKFNNDGRLKVSNEDQGALKLTCAIENYHSDAQRYTSSDEVKEQKIWLNMRMVLTDSNNKILKEKEITANANYFLSGSLQRSESAAQDDLAADAARRIVEAVVEDW